MTNFLCSLSTSVLSKLYQNSPATTSRYYGNQAIFGLIPRRMAAVTYIVPVIRRGTYLASSSTQVVTFTRIVCSEGSIVIRIFPSGPNDLCLDALFRNQKFLAYYLTGGRQGSNRIPVTWFLQPRRSLAHHTICDYDIHRPSVILSISIATASACP